MLKTFLGILLTLENLPMYGVALVFTDHQTKDLDLLDEIIALRDVKKIKIFILPSTQTRWEGLQSSSIVIMRPGKLKFVVGRRAKRL